MFQLQVHDEHVKDKENELLIGSAKSDLDDIVPEGGSGEDVGVAADLNAIKALPQGTEAAPEFLNSLLILIPMKWRNYTIRFIMTCLMIGVFAFLVYLGPMALVFLVS